MVAIYVFSLQIENGMNEKYEAIMKGLVKTSRSTIEISEEKSDNLTSLDEFFSSILPIIIFAFIRLSETLTNSVN